MRILSSRWIWRCQYCYYNQLRYWLPLLIKSPICNPKAFPDFKLRSFKTSCTRFPFSKASMTGHPTSEFMVEIAEVLHDIISIYCKTLTLWCMYRPYGPKKKPFCVEHAETLKNGLFPKVKLESNSTFKELSEKYILSYTNCWRNRGIIGSKVEWFPIYTVMTLISFYRLKTNTLQHSINRSILWSVFVVGLQW